MRLLTSLAVILSILSVKAAPTLGPKQDSSQGDGATASTSTETSPPVSAEEWWRLGGLAALATGGIAISRARLGAQPRKLTSGLSPI